jgi:hypothetical protein
MEEGWAGFEEVVVSSFGTVVRGGFGDWAGRGFWAREGRGVESEMGGSSFWSLDWRVLNRTCI